jgi:hypothetical protein
MIRSIAARLLLAPAGTLAAAQDGCPTFLPDLRCERKACFDGLQIATKDGLLSSSA